MNCMMLVNVDAAALGLPCGLRVAALANSKGHALERLGVLVPLAHGFLLWCWVQLGALARHSNHTSLLKLVDNAGYDPTTQRCKRRAFPITPIAHMKSCPEYNGGTL